MKNLVGSAGLIPTFNLGPSVLSSLRDVLSKLDINQLDIQVQDVLSSLKSTLPLVNANSVVKRFVEDLLTNLRLSPSNSDLPSILNTVGTNLLTTKFLRKLLSKLNLNNLNVHDLITIRNLLEDFDLTLAPLVDRSKLIELRNLLNGLPQLPATTDLNQITNIVNNLILFKPELNVDILNNIKGLLSKGVILNNLPQSTLSQIKDLLSRVNLSDLPILNRDVLRTVRDLLCLNSLVSNSLEIAQQVLNQL